jgi:uncharacterized low-complexity protein
LAANLRARLISAADAVIQKYRESSDPALANYEWSKARLCLVHALEIDASDRESRGKLALCDGFLNLIRNPNLPQAEQIQTSFQIAAADLPHSPDPHLGLASLYTYVFRNAGKALSEFTEAERRGFRSGPRESEQQGDALVFRADYEIRQAQRAAARSSAEERRWLRQASNDLERARTLYEPIAGFSNVNTGLDKLYRNGQLITQLNDAVAEADRKAVLQRAAELRTAALKAAALKAAALKAAALKAAALKAAELKAAELKAAELKAAELKAAELKAAELKAAELKPKIRNPVWHLGGRS